MNTLDRDFMLDISADRYANITSRRQKVALDKFGRNPLITSNTTEDIWDGGGTWVAPTQARVHNIVSSSANDAAAGTGARTIRIYGLDASWNAQSEAVTLNGVTPVATTGSYTRIFRMNCTSWGSGQTNAGDITATAVTDATVTAQISTGNNQTLMAIYTVPTGFSLYMTKVIFYVNIVSAVGVVTDTYANCQVWQSDVENPGRLIKQFMGASSVAGPSWREFRPYRKFEEKSDIILAATAVEEDCDVSAAWSGILEKDTIDW